MTLGKPVAIKLLLKLASSIKTVKQNSSSGSFDLLNSIGLKVISGVLKLLIFPCEISINSL